MDDENEWGRLVTIIGARVHEMSDRGLLSIIREDHAKFRVFIKSTDIALSWGEMKKELVRGLPIKASKGKTRYTERGGHYGYEFDLAFIMGA